ncbi:MAG: oligosaccharide flippase family protein [Clostridia bacterium]|nr:oligosaccharide flippase family protein [Clostridia bacterium]
MIHKLKQLLKTGFFHIFGSRVLNKVINFLSSAVLVRILDKGDYGIFTYAWSIYSIILLFSGMGMEFGVLHLCSEFYQDEKKSDAISNFATKFGVAFDLLLAVVILVIGLFIPLPIEGAGLLLCLMCLLPLLNLLFNLITNRLRAVRRNQEFSTLSTVNTAAVFVISVVGAFLLQEKGLVLGYYLAFLISVLVGFYIHKVRLYTKDAGNPDKKTQKDILSISAICMCNNGLSHLISLLGVFVLGIMVPNEEVLASYKVATLIPNALSFIPIALATYLYPYFTQHRGDGAWCLKRYKQVLLGLGGFNLALSLGLFVLAPWLVPFLFGNQYTDAVLVFQLLSLNYFLAGTFRVLAGNLLVTARKLKFNLVVAILSGSLNIVFDVLFIRLWGSVGAALASVVVVVVTGALNTGYLIYTYRSWKRTQTADPT